MRAELNGVRSGKSPEGSYPYVKVPFGSEAEPQEGEREA